MAMINMTKQDVIEKLRALNGEMLKNPYRQQWSADNPSLGYCYIVSEAIFHYIDAEVKAFCISMGEAGTHWFVKVDGDIVDFTSDQFDTPVDYSKAVGKGFFKGGIKTDKGYISKRGHAMAIHLGFTQ